MKKSLSILIVLIIALNSYAQQVFTVTKTTDPNPFDHPFNNVDSLCDPEMFGTLQWAINKVNKASAESVIEFNIPGAGHHEIALTYYLPQIKNKVTIDGTSQAGYQTGNPAITIRGHIKLKSCFDAYEVVNILGLHITDFSNHGIIITKGEGSQIKNNIITNIHNEDANSPGIGIRLISSYHCTIQGNIIGTGINQEETMLIDDYGIYLEKSSYCTIGDITENLKNTITNCTLGVLVEGGIRNKLSGNSIFDNHKAAIYLSNGGNTNLPAPGMTEYVDGMLKGTSQPGYTIEIFGSTGNENANYYLGTTTANDYGEWHLDITTNYPYYVTTATDFENNTSRLSALIENSRTFNCPDQYSEPCNWICNSHFECNDCENCEEIMPDSWFNTHGSADFCINNNDNCTVCSWGPNNTNNYIHMWGTGYIEDPGSALPDQLSYKGEGVFTYLTNDLDPGYVYQLSYKVSSTNITNESNGEARLIIKLVSANEVSDIIPYPYPIDAEYSLNIDNYILPEIPDGTYQTIHYAPYQPLVGWQNIQDEVEITDQNSHFDAIWIYAKGCEDSYGRTDFYLDDIVFKKKSPIETAYTEPSCVQLNEPFTLISNNSSGVSYQWEGPDGWTSNIQNPTRQANTSDVFGTYTVTIMSCPEIWLQVKHTIKLYI